VGAVDCCHNDGVGDVRGDSRTGLANFRRHTWWSIVGVTAFFLVFSVRTWVTDASVPVLARLFGVAALAVTLTACGVLISRRMAGVHPASPGESAPVAWLVAGGAGAVVLGGILLALRNYGLWSFAPAAMASIAATFLPAGRRWVLVAATAAVAAALGGSVALAAAGPVLFAAAFPAGLVLLTGWITLGMLWSWDVAERLNAARRLSAELAVKDERLRFAADLHDIQGHHLQVIALKSELAARLAQTDPARAAAEMTEVRQLAADALRDTRAVVQGYRRTTLEAEIANATRVLASAGIDARMTLGPDADHLSPPARHLLGLVMREATTNVLRHSRARHAEVGYQVSGGLAVLEVTNDGAPGPAAQTGSGTGLRSLAERLETAGGGLTWRHESGRFTVTASLPLRLAADPALSGTGSTREGPEAG
jgi:two-component system sensor histidine kinase DesK